MISYVAESDYEMQEAYRRLREQLSAVDPTINPETEIEIVLAAIDRIKHLKKQLLVTLIPRTELQQKLTRKNLMKKLKKHNHNY